MGEIGGSNHLPRSCIVSPRISPHISSFGSEGGNSFFPGLHYTLADERAVVQILDMKLVAISELLHDVGIVLRIFLAIHTSRGFFFFFLSHNFFDLR